MATLDNGGPGMAKTSSFTYQEADTDPEEMGNTERTGTKRDQKDMARLGKQQELNVRMQSEFISTTSNITSNTITSAISAFCPFLDLLVS